MDVPMDQINEQLMEADVMNDTYAQENLEEKLELMHVKQGKT